MNTKLANTIVLCMATLGMGVATAQLSSPLGGAKPTAKAAPAAAAAVPSGAAAAAAPPAALTRQPAAARSRSRLWRKPYAK